MLQMKMPGGSGGGVAASSSVIVLLLCAISSVNSYSKYGRGCGDIGCLPTEVCVLSTDACGFGQHDGKECGSYPTCKRSGAAGGSVKPSVYQQFPQASHPGGMHNPSGYPHGMQPVNPYNPSFVFGQQPYYNPSGTGGPPGGHGGGGGGGGGLAPPGAMGAMGMNLGSVGGFQNPNMFNKPPPQYLPNQNPYNRQTQSHPSSAVSRHGGGGGGHVNVATTLIGCAVGLMLWQQLWSSTAAAVMVAGRT